MFDDRYTLDGEADFGSCTTGGTEPWSLQYSR
jgi:hypothetical protein